MLRIGLHVYGGLAYSLPVWLFQYNQRPFELRGVRRCLRQGRVVQLRQMPVREQCCLRRHLHAGRRFAKLWGVRKSLRYGTEL